MRDERDMRSAIVTHLNHIFMTAVLDIFYLRVVQKGSIRKMQRWMKREKSCCEKELAADSLEETGIDAEKMPSS